MFKYFASVIAATSATVTELTTRAAYETAAGALCDGWSYGDCELTTPYSEGTAGATEQCAADVRLHIPD